MYTKGQREQERNHGFLKIAKISNHRIRAREREAMKGAKMPIHAVATWVRRQQPKAKAFCNGGFGHCGACVPARTQKRGRLGKKEEKK